MKKQEKRKVGGAKRGANLVVRVSPEMRYLAEIAARVQRRTVSSFAEWAIDQALQQTELRGSTVGKLRRQLWDVDEADRFVSLAEHYPELLTHEEQVLWKLITNHLYFCLLEREKLREWWDTLKEVARGELPKGALPEEPPIPDVKARK